MLPFLVIKLRQGLTQIFMEMDDIAIPVQWFLQCRVTSVSKKKVVLHCRWLLITGTLYLGFLFGMVLAKWPYIAGWLLIAVTLHCMYHCICLVFITVNMKNIYCSTVIMGHMYICLMQIHNGLMLYVYLLFGWCGLPRYSTDGNLPVFPVSPAFLFQEKNPYFLQECKWCLQCYFP